MCLGPPFRFITGHSFMYIDLISAHIHPSIIKTAAPSFQIPSIFSAINILVKNNLCPPSKVFTQLSINTLDF